MKTKKKTNEYWKPIQLGEKQENEVKVYSVATGNLPMPPFIPKASKEAIDYIMKLDGLIGVYPDYPHGSLWLFKTKNHAKRAKNLMEAKRIQTGTNICEFYIDKSYVKD